MFLKILLLIGSLLLIATIAFVLKVLLRVFCEFIYEKYKIAENTTMATLYLCALGSILVILYFTS